MGCVTCGTALSNDFKAVVLRKQQQYKKYGTVFMVYEIEGVWQYCRGEYFQAIKEAENVGEFYHISEFKID